MAQSVYYLDKGPEKRGSNSSRMKYFEFLQKFQVVSGVDLATHSTDMEFFFLQG